MKRRSVLASATVVITGMAGCLSENGTNLGGSTSQKTTTTADTETETKNSTRTTSTTSEPTYEILPSTAPEGEIDCDSNSVPITQGDLDSYPSATEDFELTATEENIDIGDQISFILTNVSEEQKTISPIFLYNMLKREDGKWKNIYYTEERETWSQLGIRVEPNGGYKWEFTLTATGLERKNGSANPSYHVCNSLEPGTYRFVFFGLSGDTLAVQFTVSGQD